VVELGVTGAEPEAATVPTPEMVTEVALLAFQLNVVLVPLLMLAGCAVRTIVGFWDGTGELCDPDPPHPAAAMKKDNRIAMKLTGGTPDMTNSPRDSTGLREVICVRFQAILGFFFAGPRHLRRSARSLRILDVGLRYPVVCDLRVQKRAG